MITKEELAKESVQIRLAVATIAALFQKTHLSPEEGIRVCEIVIQYAKDPK